MNINYTHFKTIAVCLLTFFSYNCSVAQEYSEETSVIPDYRIIYNLGKKSNSVSIECKSTGKKTKVAMPDKERWLDQVWSIESLPMFKIKTKTNFIGDDKYHILYLNYDGTYKFLYNSKDRNYSFDGIDQCILVSSRGIIFDQNGNEIENVDPKNPRDCYVNLVKINLANEKAGTSIYYDNTYRKLKLTTHSEIIAVDMEPYFIYFQGDSLTYFDYKKNQQTATYFSLPKSYTDEFLSYTGKWKEDFLKQLRIHKLFPVQTGSKQYAYLNAAAETAIQPFAADLALPFILPKEQAPVFLNGKWGIMNTKGEMTVPFRLDSISIQKSNIEFKSNDTLYHVDASTGKLRKTLIISMTDTKTENKKPQRNTGFACLVYILENPDNISSKRMAYILVSLTYNADNVDHNKMSSWVLNRVDPEILALQERGYYRTADLSYNHYDADLLYEKSCYYCQEEYKAKSLNVTVIEKSFY
ncbi:MAG TPA: hypothetical protein PLD87_10865 [Bacteroidia bacterium]|nr:hypothetical protein [Bacteroidia bacterium]